MARYACSYALALSTTNDVRTIQSVATGQGSTLKIFEVFVGGEASSSTVARLVANRPSASPTGAATNVVPEKIDPASVAAAFTNASTYATTQSTLSTNDILTISFNAFGGVVRWIPAPDGEIIVGTQGAIAYLSFRSRSGTPSVGGHFLVEER